MSSSAQLGGHSGGAGKRGRPSRNRAKGILLVLLAVPLLEITLIIAMGQAVGPWWTFGALILLSVLGAFLVRREGTRTWRRLRVAVRTGTPPAREVADAALVLVGGAMLLTPGFLTDAIGLFLVLPLTRPITRRWLQVVVASKLLGATEATRRRGPNRPGGGSSRADEVIEGEIIDDDPGPSTG